jgi:hypothetical protein
VRADAAAADRRHEVREAARAWRHAGAIDDATLAAIEAAHPDDRARLGPAFRALVFFFTGVVALAALGLLFFALRPDGDQETATLSIVLGLLLIAATEVQTGPLRRAQGGSEMATAFLGVVYLFAGTVWRLARTMHEDDWINLTLALAVVLCAAAAWRWGYALFAAAALALLFVLSARFPAGRLLWIVGGLAVAAALVRAGEAASLCPAHRRGARAGAAVALAAVYMAVNLRSWDARWVERISPGDRHAADTGGLFFAAGVATALVPLLTLFWGVRRRRRWMIALGTAGVIASLVTVRYYVHVAPLWVVLTAGGAAALAVAAAVRRYLDSGPGGERAGLTTDPLFSGGEAPRALEIAVAAATRQAQAERPAPGFEPGGGRYGGGGAGGQY